MRHSPRASLLLSATFALALSSALGRPAHAGPWVLPQGIVVLGVSAGTDYADEEFLPDGQQQIFPLNGAFHSYNLALDARGGVGSGFELGGRVTFKGVSYTADALVLPPDAAEPALEDFRRSTVSFSQARNGVADLFLNAAYQHLDGAFRLSSSLELKIPSGYEPPAGTFRREAVRQEELADDVTLGDGLFAAEYRLQSGGLIASTRTLLQLDAGYRARFNGPGHQALAEAKLGQFVDPRLLFIASAQLALTLFEGESIGTGLIAIDPGVEALRFSAENVRAVEIRLDQDLLQITGGAILKLDRREIILSVSRVVWGTNIPALTSAQLSTLFIFD